MDSRSVVWVTPTADATITVDFNDDGTFVQNFNLDRLEALRLIDPNDQDMTGALIFATDANREPVDIAVAWGQDPDLSQSGDSNALDLGTLVPPLPIVAANKTATVVNDVDGDGLADPGDTLRYTIRVVNIGRVDLPANSLVIEDILPDYVTYITNSTVYNDGSNTPISDTGATDFPLDEGGLRNISILSAGDAHEITFDVVIDGIADLTPGTEEIINTGSVTGGPDNEDPTFEARTPLDFDPAIEVQKTVVLGHDGGASFGNSTELVSGANGADVTYYFEVTNTGATYLDNIAIDDNDLGININDLTLLSGAASLAPGASAVYFYETTINGDLTNTATATGNPTYNDGTDIDVDGDSQTDDTVSDDDTATVDEVATATVFGHVFEDTNDNGVQDAGEADLAGVDVVITDSQGNSQTVTTDADGNYSATVPAGSTTADVDETTLPAGYVDGTVTDDPTTVNVPAGSNTDLGDDGYVECFLTGTHILTDKGEVPVETLKIGDLVQTVEGTLEPIKWIGHQTTAASKVRNPLRGLPILIKAGALGNNLPKRDLYVSPDHAMLVDGLLINAGALVNDVSIIKTQPTEAFTYYHVELDKHALLVAEGSAAESYLPQKEDRYCYDNGAEYEALYPNQCNMILWPLDYPRVSSYTTVPRYVRKNLMAIAQQLEGVQVLQHA